MQSGIVRCSLGFNLLSYKRDKIILFATLMIDSVAQEHQYEDRVHSADLF